MLTAPPTFTLEYYYFIVLIYIYPFLSKYSMYPKFDPNFFIMKVRTIKDNIRYLTCI